MDVLQAIQTRASVRAFAADEITADRIDTLLRAAVRAPTAMHGEPWLFVIVQDAAKLAHVDQAAKRGVLAKALASHVIGADFDACYGANTLIVICAKALGPLVDADCWLAAENLMLAATGIGLGTCCIGSAIAALNEPHIKAELGIPLNVRAVVPIAVGVPLAVTTPTDRHDPNILSWVLNRR